MNHQDQQVFAWTPVSSRLPEDGAVYLTVHYGCAWREKSPVPEIAALWFERGEWVDADSSEPNGIEPELVREFARGIGARVLWSRGSETSLAQALKHHELDLAIGGFDAKTPWKSIAGVSRPFVETADMKKHVFLTAPGESRFILTLDTFLTERMRASRGQG